MDSPLIDPLAKYHNTRLLYKDIKLYLLKYNINRNTPSPEVMVRVNKCVKFFVHKHKPEKKVVYLCIKYLDSIDFFSREI